MDAKKNTRHLLRTFLPLLIFYVGCFIFVFFASLKGKDYGLLLFFGIFFLLYFGGAVLLFVITNRRMQNAFRSEEPQKLISISDPSPRFLNWLYDRIFFKFIPAYRVVYYLNRANAYIYWGQYSQAREILVMMDEENLPPMHRASAVHVKALLCYFEQGDFAEGIRLAEQYERMTQVEKVIPWHNWLARNTHSLVGFGQVASGIADAATFSSVEQQFNSRFLVIRLLSAWALEKGYLQRGEAEKASEMHQFIHQTAPYCKAFTGGETPEPSTGL